MSSTYGDKLRITIFGQSHSAAIGVVIEGLEAGFAIDTDKLEAFLSRRSPGASPLSTARREADIPEFVSGLAGGVTCGAPLCAVIRNTDTRSKDYSDIADRPRPGHADYTAAVKWNGANDVAGGGHFSGRLTAPLCIAGGIAMQILESRGIYVGGHISCVAGIQDASFEPVLSDPETILAPARKTFPVIDDRAGDAMQKAILEARSDGDSVGGAVECAVVGMPVGAGDPMFDGMENRIAKAVFGVPAVKGIEFGAGFGVSKLRGSENNDPFYMSEDRVRTRTNNHGGILGGITSGMPIVFRVALKPTPSIAKSQETVSLSGMEDSRLEIRGRHDPCIVHRALPAVEAAAALASLDALYCM